MKTASAIKNTCAKAMYINSDEDFFIQLHKDGYYFVLANGEVSVPIFGYNLIGKLKDRTKSGILITDWRLEHE